jgi:hypothetical protein
MLIKTLALHSLPSVLAIAGSMVASQPDFRGSASAFQQGVSYEADTFAGQIVNRMAKSDRLQVKGARPQVEDKAPVRIPAQCKPTDVVGRCFADLDVKLAAA